MHQLIFCTKKWREEKSICLKSCLSIICYESSLESLLYKKI